MTETNPLPVRLSSGFDLRAPRKFTVIYNAAGIEDSSSPFSYNRHLFFLYIENTDSSILSRLGN